MTRPFALIVGDPITHSLSPVIHGTAYRELGLDWDFSKRQVSAGGQLAELLGEFRSQPGFEDGTACRGLAVTMPLKPEALECATYVDGLAKVTGAVNTLVPAIGDWAGFNTDVAGIVGAFREAGFAPQTPGFTAVIFGSGATAASGLAALRELGAARLVIVSRQPQGDGNAFAAAARMHLPVTAISWQDTAKLTASLEQATLILSTVPAPAQPGLPLPQIDSPAAVLDAVYDPWPSPVVTWAQQFAAGVIPGWEMLLYQGIAQVKLFTGQEVAARTIREALLKAIKTRPDSKPRLASAQTKD